MSIKFICTCGKHLRARDEMAGRRSVCPQCGRPVGIPANEPTQRGTDAAPPLTPTERVQHDSGFKVFGLEPPQGAAPSGDFMSYQVVVTQEEQGPPPPPREPAYNLADVGPLPDPRSRDQRSRDARLDRLLHPAVVQRVKRRRAPRPWLLEKHWYECLIFPLRAWPLVLGLGAALTLLTGVIVALLQSDLDSLQKWVFYYVTGMFALVVVGYTCGVFQCVLFSAGQGEFGLVRWPGGDLRLVLHSVIACVLSFLAGPVVPLVVAVMFWLNAGDLELVDYLILLQLGVVALGYWLLAFASVTINDRLRDVAPGAVVHLVRRIGLRALGVAAVAAFLIYGHLVWALTAVEEGHRSGAGWFLLIIIWSCLLYCVIFLLRWLGLCWYRRPEPTAEPAPQAGLPGTIPVPTRPA